jgi:hypothetical protein
MVKAHETEFDGCRYRSRLEATWACFFTKMGWKFQYEPFDLYGYVPDFAIVGEKETVIVEVKPYSHFKEYKDNGVIEKIEKATIGDCREILLLGISVFGSNEFDGACSVGWLAEVYVEEGKNVYSWGDCILDEKGFNHSYNSYRNRVSGECDGDHHLRTIEYQKGKRIFNLAQNETRYMFAKTNAK